MGALAREVETLRLGDLEGAGGEPVYGLSPSASKVYHRGFGFLNRRQARRGRDDGLHLDRFLRLARH